MLLTANENSRCHGGHCVWCVAEVQHVSRHLVQAVYRIFKHEGHHHIGELEDGRKMGREWEGGGGGTKQGNSISERWSELRKHADER